MSPTRDLFGKSNKIPYIFAAILFALMIAVSQIALMISGYAAQPYGRVAYTRSVDRTGSSGQETYDKIFTSSTVGGGQVRVSGQGDYDDKYPSYSPDGTNQVRVTTNGSPATDRKYHPSYSPDGSSIIFSEDDADAEGVTSVRTVDANGSNLATVMSGDDDNPFQLVLPVIGTYPSYSPDGTKIIYSQSGNIYTLDVDGGVPATLVDDAHTNAYHHTPRTALKLFSCRSEAVLIRFIL